MVEEKASPILVLGSHKTTKESLQKKEVKFGENEKEEICLRMKSVKVPKLCVTR